VRVGGSRSGHLEDARQFIDALRTKDASEAIPKLIEILGDESWYLRERAGEAIVAFGATAAPALEELLRAGLWYTRAAALQVLGRIAAPRTLLAVAGYLSDPNRAIAQESGRALFGYCGRGGAVAVAKLLHARGPIQRDRALALMRQLDADGASRLARLIETPALMGPEGSLTADEQERLALCVRDEAWGVDWEQLGHGEPLPEWREDVVRHLRGGL
jgi:HEAT repeat protein